MKKVLFTLLFSLVFLSLSAQDFEIVSVESLPADMSAREEMKTDHNDRQCALLRVATQNITPEQREKFIFKSDLGSEVVERASRIGEIWLWVSPGLKYLRIMHPDWGQYELRLIDHVAKVEALHTYKITLRGTLSLAMQEQETTSPAEQCQYLVFQLSPTNAMLEVDGQLWEVGPDGTAMKCVNYGTYSYRVIAPNHIPETGKAMVDDPDDPKTVNVKLKSDFVEVTFKVDADAEIWVNNEKKGTRTWTGSLGKGNYRIECKQEGHEPTMISKEITAETNGQTIILPVPKPIYGSLNVESTPSICKLFIDGKDMGTTPKSIHEILIGHHELRLTKDGYKDYYETITIVKGERKQVKATLDNDKSMAPPVRPQQPVAKEPTSSVFFMMANAAFSNAPQTSFGLTVSYAKRFGGYLSVNSNFNFQNADYECDSDGYISGLMSEYSYSGTKKTSRLSATAGVVMRIVDPTCAYVGAGYGFRNLFWELNDGRWSKNTEHSFQGVALDAGIMLHFHGFGFSLGIQTIGVKYLEAKVGVGYTLKKN